MASPITRRRQARARAHTPPPARRTVRASASKLRLDNRKMLDKQWVRRQAWQDEAWAYFDEIPELHYAVRYQGNVLAKARWFVGVRDPANPEAEPVPITDPGLSIPGGLQASAEAELARLHGPAGAMSELARDLGMNLSVAAEAYLIGFAERTSIAEDGSTQVDQPEEWDIRSVSEVDKGPDGSIVVKSGPNDSTGRTLDSDLDACIRIWQRHPRFSSLPDGNMRGVLGECEALVLLSNQVKAEAKSRTPAGILFLSNDLSLGPSGMDIDGDNDSDDSEQDITEVLYQAFSDAIEDPSSAASVSPVIVQGPTDGIKESKHLTIGRETSPVLEERIAARVLRIARGMNIPVEVVLGSMNTTYANAQQIDADIYEKHTKPDLVLVADSFTVGFLQPNLLDSYPALADVIANVVVWFDASDIVSQADPLESALEALNLDVISEETYRRLKGFTEDDAPDPVERLIRTVLHLRTYDPGISTAILELMGVPLEIPESLPSSGAPATNGATANQAIPRMLAAAVDAKRNGHDLTTNGLARAALAASLPKRAQASANVGYQLMQIDRELRARLHMAANATMDRVLERAGRRLQNKFQNNPEIRATLSQVDPVHFALTLGQPLIASAGFSDTDLVDEDAFDALEEQFLTWGANAQARAVATVKKVVSLTDEAAANIASRQFDSLRDAWTWMKDALHDLAVARVYNPDPLAPNLGEFDPTSRVPTGLIRQAVSRAGGASSLVTVQGDNPYVVLNNGEPPGGIATGELVRETLSDAGAAIEAYEWVYGPAFRVTPFEEHEALDGEVFADFEADVLVSAGEFDAYYYPGDHVGCACDWSPVIGAPEDLESE